MVKSVLLVIKIGAKVRYGVKGTVIFVCLSVTARFINFSHMGCFRR